MSKKRIWKKALLAAGVLLVVTAFVLLLRYEQLILVSNDLKGAGNYELEVQYCLSNVNADDVKNLVLKTIIKQMKITADVIKNGDLYRVRLFQDEGTIPFLEFYRRGEDILVNAGCTANWLLQSAKKGTEIEWIEEISEVEDFYISTDTFCEWIGAAQTEEASWITQLIEFPPQGLPVICQAPENRQLSLERQLIEGYFQYETSDKTKLIVSAYAIPFTDEEREIYEWVKQEDGTVYELLAKYTVTDIVLTMPEENVSAIEGILLKKIFQALLQ